MSTRYQIAQKEPLGLPADLAVPLSILSTDSARIVIFSGDSLGPTGILAGIPFHTQYEGTLNLGTSAAATLLLGIQTRHVFADGRTFDSVRSLPTRVVSNEFKVIPLAEYSSVSFVNAPRDYVDAQGETLRVTPGLIRQPVSIELALIVEGYNRAITQRRDVMITSLSPSGAAVTWWQLYATRDLPPDTPPVPTQDDTVEDPGAGASGALLRVQRALVARFNAFVAGGEGVQDAFARYGLSLPKDERPRPMLFDEVPAGEASFWRIGDASIGYEIGTGLDIYRITQDIEAHVDPVRGRATALAMGDVIERAFAPTDYPRGRDEPEAEPWIVRNALALIGADEAASPVVITDIKPAGARIGYSEAGLTYQVIVTYEIMAEPIRNG